MPLAISAGFRVNSLFWVRSLLQQEQGPTRRVLEDLEPFFKSIHLPFQLIDVNTAADLYTFLDELARTRHKPILQFDMHGNSKGFSIAEAHELAPWTEVVPRLRAVNITSEGNLCVVAGVCFGLHAIKLFSINDACPVSMLIAPQEKVTDAFLEDGLVNFYKSVFEEGDVNDAQASHLGDPFKVFHAERFFVVAMCRYIKQACRGKAALARRERLLTEILQASPDVDVAAKREFRKKIKEGIRPDQGMLDAYAHRFLLGKRCPFTIDQIMDFVERA